MAAAADSPVACALAAAGHVPDTVTVVGGEAPPPLPTLPAMVGTGRDGGFDTATVALLTTSAAGIVTVTCEEVTVVGGMVAGVNCSCVEPNVQTKVVIWGGVDIMEPVRKFVPATVNERAAPEVVQVGETEETVGMGLAGLPTIKLMVPERPLLPVPEAGLRVFTGIREGFVSWEAAIVATTLRTFPLLSVVTVVLHTALPGIVPAVALTGQVLVFHWTLVWATKPLPFIVTITEGQVVVEVDTQAGICEGEIEVRAAPVGV